MIKRMLLKITGNNIRNMRTHIEILRRLFWSALY